MHDEIAFIAYYFHWAYDDVLAMEHRERRDWCEAISRINKRLNDGTEK